MNKRVVTPGFWLRYAKANQISWTYHTVDESPIGRVDFSANQRPDVRVTLVGKDEVSLFGLTNRGRALVDEIPEECAHDEGVDVVYDFKYCIKCRESV